MIKVNQKRTLTILVLLIVVINEINFDLDLFLAQNIDDSNKYINSFKGFCVENIEYLVDIPAHTGSSSI